MAKQELLLIAFLGSIGVGKSFFARQLAPKIDAVRLNADAARLAMFGSLDELNVEKQFFGEESNKRLFGVIDYATQQILAAGTSVVYDTARFNGQGNREILKKIAKETGARLVYVWLETPRETALKRVIERDEVEDQRKLDMESAERIFKSHDERFDPPQNEESIIHIDGTIPFNEQFKLFKEQLDKL